MSDNQTLLYYEDKARMFFDNTVNVSFHEQRSIFIADILPKSRILDLGCGSGRDAKYFLQKGFQVDAVDGSAKICKLASDYIGIPVKQMQFDELDCTAIYDGVWACASILHLPYEDLKRVLGKIFHALKPAGVFYTSFKYGEREGYRNGRYFTDMTEEKMLNLLDQNEGFTVKEIWLTSDVRLGRENEKWLNILLIKNSQYQK